MTSEAEQPPNPQLGLASTQFTLALRRAILLLTKWSARARGVSPATVAAKSRAEAAIHGDGDDIGNRSREALPWWVTHHPAVSFRGREPDEPRD